MRVGFEWLKRLWLDERFDGQKTALGGGFAVTGMSLLQMPAQKKPTDATFRKNPRFLHHASPE
jgi:hypothetical protein